MPQLLREPSWLDRNSWYSDFQNNPLSDGIIVSHDKTFGASKRVQNVPLTKLIGPNNPPSAPGLFNRFQSMWEDVANGAVPYNKIWMNGRAYNFDDSIENLANSVYFGVRGQGVIFSQMMEDSNIHGSSDPDANSRYSKCEAILRRIAEKIESIDQIPVVNNKVVADYFGINYGYYTNIKMNEAGLSAAVAGMQNVTDAKKTNLNAQGVWITNNYESQHCYEYRHRMIPGYIEGLGSQREGHGIYGLIYNHERNYAQRPDRGCYTYANGVVEGLTFPGIDGSGTWQRFPLRDAGADLIRLSSIEGNYDLLKAYAYFSLLLGEGYIIWDDNAQYGTNDKNFDVAYFGGYEPWKTKLQKDGQGIVQYDPNNPTHPKRETTGGQFSGNHGSHNNGGWAGNWLYGKTWNRANGSLRWAEFNYVENGNARSGYVGGNSPEPGVLGHGEVCRWGVQNYGQANCAKSFFDNQRPILMHGVGTDTSKEMYVGFNCHCGPLGVTTYNIPGGSFTIKGDGLFIVYP